MRSRQAAKIAASFLAHPVYTAYALGARPAAADAADVRDSIRRAADWLLRAQSCAPDGEGYSRRYRLHRGWDRCYIETTGYIIPTLLDVARLLDAAQYRTSAERAAEWLLGVQSEDGAFTDVDFRNPQAFDTGQVLLGLSRMYRDSKDARFLDAARRASDWLVGVQERDGSWVSVAYEGRPHAYYSRVAAALIEVGRLSGEESHVEAGRRNLEWVISNEQPNAYFAYSEFRHGEDAYLHTIVYVLEGFVMAFEQTGEVRWRDAFLRGADALRRLVNAEGLLYSQYDKAWNATNKEYCVTGLAQYAGVCFDVFRLTGDQQFSQLGSRIVDRLCGWQQDRGADIAGALPSSIPLWGRYGGMEFFNWNSKFFIDAAIKCLKVRKAV